MTSGNAALRAALVVLVLACSQAVAQVRAVYDHGAGALARQLERLQTTASVMHTGAHPDDEDSALVAWHARGENARTTYLSLTRGDGGQNIIGPEQSELLGVIRTEELLQARRLDGAEQHFTRAVDYGFSKVREEAARIWDEDRLLEDMVRAIRLFRPDVVVSRWRGTPADGHGHHRYTGYLTPIAVAAAADPARYPQQIAEGLRPWTVKKRYVMTREEAAGEPGVFAIDTGSWDPLAGRSYFEIGMQGRSQQKTQQMGQLELRGSQLSWLERVDALPAREETSVFDGIDTSITGIAGLEPEPARALVRGLRRLESLAADAASLYNPLHPAALIESLAEGLETARRLPSLAGTADARRLIEEKAREFETALVMAAGVEIDALADRETVVPGEALPFAVRVYDPGIAEVVVESIDAAAREGWPVTATDADVLDSERDFRRSERATGSRVFSVRIPSTAEPTQPYWLERPKNGAMYDWSQAGVARTLPFRAPLIEALARLTIAGQPVELRRDVQYRGLDRVRGELRRRIDVVPAVTVAAATDLVILPLSSEGGPQVVPLTLANQTGSELEARLSVRAPDGWTPQLGVTELKLPPAPATVTVAMTVERPDSAGAGDYRLRAQVQVGDATYDRAMQTIAYPHIRTHRVYRPAETEFEVIDVAVAPVRVGYVMGSGDLVPDALRALGVDVTLLDDATLATGDLSAFDTIVVGIRASQ
ncbi:MAG: PIG-L family deacetylase, partial [Woeseiaceae bacterium]|nr:PIG-L family deacetylase [Woeseiaceae bacterium]